MQSFNQKSRIDINHTGTEERKQILFKIKINDSETENSRNNKWISESKIINKMMTTWKSSENW